MDVLTKVRDLVKPQYENVTWAHGWPHVVSVVKTSEILSGMVGVDPVISGIAAYCHDLGRSIETTLETLGVLKNYIPRHDVLSVGPTNKVLKDIGIKGQDYDFIIGAVAIHSEFQYAGDNLYAKVLRGSDRKDAIGPWGAIRTIEFNLNLGPMMAPDAEIQDDIEQIAGIKTSMVCRGSSKAKEIYLDNLNKVLEWKDLPETDAERELLAPDYAYTELVKERLLASMK